MIDHGTKCNGQPCTCWDVEHVPLARECVYRLDDGSGRPGNCVYPKDSHPSYCKTTDGRIFNRV